MPEQRWTEVVEIFEEAVALPAERRREYLETRCAHEPELLGRVRSLLTHHYDEEAIGAAPRGLQSVRVLHTQPFLHDQRFERLSLIGSGGFGSVYRAFDTLRQEWVAVKVLREIDPARLERFKTEFRRATRVTHRNIVQLHELFSDGERWFFSMELVEGLPLVEYVRGTRPGDTRPLTRPALERLRRAFCELTEAVAALHASGIVHGDLKPDNVLVTPDGRVVLLDFGLVREIAEPLSLLAGTPVYMAPEVFDQAPVAEAGDWYSVGVMLYEALTAGLPFTGSFWNVIHSKQSEQVRIPGGNFPPQLVALCQSLLQQQPERRPTSREIYEQLAGVDAAPRVPASMHARPPFVGRSLEMAALAEAFGRLQTGAHATIRVTGRSGIGKTTLVQRFLDELRPAHAGLVVLAGRCYESESVPYKALDEVVDELSQYLRAQPAADVLALLPRDVPLLTRVFPVLRRVPVIAAHPPDLATATSGSGLRDVRNRAIRALGELLDRLSRQKRVVIWIDDIQWGDLDSARVLSDLQNLPAVPPLLWILSYRSEDVASSAVLQTLEAVVQDDASAGQVHALNLSRLGDAEAEALASLLCGPLSQAQATHIVREADGSPLFIQELAQHDGATHDARGRSTLSELIQRRVRALPRAAQELLEVIAIAGGPLALHTAARAVRLEDPTAQSQLKAGHLTRSCRIDAVRALDTYHDQVRDAVLALMPVERQRDCHARLASALQQDSDNEPERLVRHLAHAGIYDAAYRRAVQAADAARQHLAFNLAARLLRVALDLRVRLEGAAAAAAAHEEPVLRQRLALALSQSGRSDESAREYLLVAEHAPPEEGRELRRLAADQLMRSGRINEGLDLLTATLREQQTRIPRSRTLLVGGLLLTRARNSMRLATRPWHSPDASPALLARIDRLWTAGVTLWLVDPLLSAYLRSRHLQAALKAGDPRRLAGGLAFEAMHRATAGPLAYPAARGILDQAHERAAACADPFARGLVLLAESSVASSTGRVLESLRVGIEAETIFLKECTGATWELSLVRLHILSALSFAGRWTEYAPRLAAVMHETSANGDRYTQCALPLISACYVTFLAKDDPEGAHRELDDELRRWNRAEFDIPRFAHCQGTVESMLYARRYEEAWRVITKVWRQYRSGQIFWSGLMKLLAQQLRARAALAMMSATADRSAARVAREFCTRARRSPWLMAQGWGLMIDAGLAMVERDQRSAATKLQLAEQRFLEAGLAHLQAACRRRRGEVRGGAEGVALVASADDQLRTLGAVNPQRMAERLAPGDFWCGR